LSHSVRIKIGCFSGTQKQWRTSKICRFFHKHEVFPSSDFKNTAGCTAEKGP
jgi:hypothetical protein